MKTYKFVVVGGGLTGLTIIHQLLSMNKNPKDILIIDPHIEMLRSKESPKIARESIFEVAKREASLSGLGKAGQPLLKENPKFSTDSYFWGTSCRRLELYEIDTHEIDGAPIDFQEAYQWVENLWNVSVVNSDENNDENSFLRKQFSRDSILRNPSLSHSELALNLDRSIENHCLKASQCFSGCPNQAVTTPKKLFAKLETSVDLHRGSVTRLDEKNKVITLDSGTLVGFEKCYLSLTPEAVAELLGDTFHETFVLRNTPVKIIPYISLKPTDDDDFNNHFHFCDLVKNYPNRNSQSHYLQIYAPSREIAGRAIARLPSWVSRALETQFLSKIFQKIARHLGVAMIFYPSELLGEKKRTAADKFNYSKSITKLVRKDLIKARLFLLPWISVNLVSGASRHVGVLTPIGQEDMDSKLASWEELYGIYLCGPARLTQLPAGPHTAIAAARSIQVVASSLI